jgi:hypothetical protein
MKNDKIIKCIEYITNYDPYEFTDPSERSHDIVKNQLPHIIEVRRELLENLIPLEHQYQTNLIKTVVAELDGAAQLNKIKYLEKDSTTNEYASWTKYLQIRMPGEEDEFNLYEIFDFVLLLLIEIESVCTIYNITFTKILQDQNIILGPGFRFEPEEISIITSDSILTNKRIEENKLEQKLLYNTPIFKPEAIPIIFEFHKDFFSREHQVQFKDLLLTGSKPNEKLLFMDNGNRLTDTFKRLIEHGFITGCTKKALQEWICQTFLFLQGNVAKPYKIETVERTIYGNQNPCKNPLIQIINGQIVNDLHPRQNKSSNY